MFCAGTEVGTIETTSRPTADALAVRKADAAPCPPKFIQFLCDRGESVPKKLKSSVPGAFVNAEVNNTATVRISDVAGLESA